jgi:uncharacterized protein
MLGEIEYYLDSYALIAILEGNTNYRKVDMSHGVTTLLNLMEVQYYLHSKGIPDEEIKDTLNYMLPMCINYSPIDSFDSVKFRFENKAAKLSYVDCLGYMLAKKRNLEFVTGDEGFRHFENVMFIKV